MSAVFDNKKDPATRDDIRLYSVGGFYPLEIIFVV
jgi:hypothetical protein